MPFTYAVNLKPEPRKDGTHAVRIRVTKGRPARYFTLGIYVRPSQWNKKAKYENENWCKGYPMAEVDNNTIKNTLDGLKLLGLEKHGLDSRELMELYASGRKGPEEGPAPDFLKFFLEFIEEKSTVTFGTLKNYRGTHRILSDFAGGALPFQDLTVSFLHRFVAHLKETLTDKTIQQKLMVLGSAAKEAMKRGLLEYAANPFPRVTVRGKSRKKVPLSAEKLQELAAMEFPKKKYEQNLEVARDVFMAQFYIHGARVSDVLELKWTDLKDRLRYEMRKNGKTKSLLAGKDLLDIIEKYRPLTGRNTYIFPLIKENYGSMTEEQQTAERTRLTKVMNNRLRVLAERMEVDRFTTHCARYTFANEALNYTDLRTLQNMLMHYTVATTEVYTRDFKEGDDDQATDMIYSKGSKVKPQ